MINEYTQTEMPINLEQTHLMNKDRLERKKRYLYSR